MTINIEYKIRNKKEKQICSIQEIKLSEEDIICFAIQKLKSINPHYFKDYIPCEFTIKNIITKGAIK